MIRIQNIYYMLSYAYQVLKEQEYMKCSAEEFENTADLFSAILAKGMAIQMKRGLLREYIPKNEPISSPHGKIDISESIKTQAIMRRQLVCSYDEFSVNAYLNQIIKTTVHILLCCDISKKQKKELRKRMLYFQDVAVLNPYRINWKIKFHRNNQEYEMLLGICYLVIKGLLQGDNSGRLKLRRFLDEQRMSRLYEKFILNYYKKEFPLIHVSAARIPWNLDDGMAVLLPVMQSDIMLSYQEKTLVIDAKFYEHTTYLNQMFGNHTVHSHNLYQIFTYVKNKDIGNTGNVAGMLLYAKTDEEITPNYCYQMSGNKISVATLDLGLPFADIAAQLNTIVMSYFGMESNIHK